MQAKEPPAHLRSQFAAVHPQHVPRLLLVKQPPAHLQPPPVLLVKQPPAQLPLPAAPPPKRLAVGIPPPPPLDQTGQQVRIPTAYPLPVQKAPPQDRHPLGLRIGKEWSISYLSPDQQTVHFSRGYKHLVARVQYMGLLAPDEVFAHPVQDF